ncbi:hypothetical protein B5X24_HaOG205052 [Helicoverpa armigera]|nr:hypothetical protein B5X24_HaOG205052 [Helicoverpa armigera]
MRLATPRGAAWRSAKSLASLSIVASRRVSVLESDVLEQLQDIHFVENCIDILVDFCNVKDYKQSFEANVSLTLLERRAELEVRAQKGVDEYVSPSQELLKARPPPTGALVTALANALHNVSAFTHCPVQAWNERGLYRLLFSTHCYNLKIDIS